MIGRQMYIGGASMYWSINCFIQLAILTPLPNNESFSVFTSGSLSTNLWCPQWVHVPSF